MSHAIKLQYMSFVFTAGEGTKFKVERGGAAKYQPGTRAEGL